MTVMRSVASSLHANRSPYVHSATVPTQGHHPVHRPAHYTDGQIEVADFIADKNFNFFLGNVVKYVSRAGKKDPLKQKEDLEKAKWYLEREIERLSDAATQY